MLKAPISSSSLSIGTTTIVRMPLDFDGSDAVRLAVGVGALLANIDDMGRLLGADDLPEAGLWPPDAAFAGNARRTPAVRQATTVHGKRHRQIRTGCRIWPRRCASHCQHRLKYRLQLAGRAGDHAQHLRGRGLLLQRFGELAGARLHLVEQPHVLDRDHRLVGEGLTSSICSGGEWSSPRATRKHDNADRLPVSQERNAKNGAITERALAVLAGASIVVRIGQDIREPERTGRPWSVRPKHEIRAASAGTGCASAVCRIRRSSRSWRRRERHRRGRSDGRAKSASHSRAADCDHAYRARSADRRVDTADDLEHVGGGGLLLARLIELAPERGDIRLFRLWRRDRRGAALRGAAQVPMSASCGAWSLERQPDRRCFETHARAQPRCDAPQHEGVGRGLITLRLPLRAAAACLLPTSARMRATRSAGRKAP